MSGTHIIRTPFSDASLCGAEWESAAILSEHDADLKGVDCIDCRDRAGLKGIEAPSVYLYSMRIVVPKEISLRDMEYIESHVESFLATMDGGEASINADPEKLDAAETGHEHLLNEG